jgi:dual specificity tyrosine-phosphorylation-regulated kinase 2/3/4
MRIVRPVAHDVIEAMAAYDTVGVVHCCITGRNVCLVPGTNTKFRLIDFSHAFVGAVAPAGLSLDLPREYLAPEAVFGMQFGIGIDMWALDCLLVEIASGKSIFSARNNVNHLAAFAALMRMPDMGFVAASPRKADLFDTETGWVAKGYLDIDRPEKSNNLRSFLGTADVQFCDFLMAIFVWEPDKRLSPKAALTHPWIANRDARVADVP